MIIKNERIGVSIESKNLQGFRREEECQEVVEFLLPDDDDKGMKAAKVWLLIVHIFMHLVRQV